MAVKKGPQCGQGLPFYQKQNHFVRICSKPAAQRIPASGRAWFSRRLSAGDQPRRRRGLLRCFPKRGIVVSGITVSDIRMIFLRCAPWSSHTRCAPAAITSTSMRSSASPKSFTILKRPIIVRILYELDDRFHLFLISACRMIICLDLYARIQTQEYPAAHHERSVHRPPPAGRWRSMRRSLTPALRGTGACRIRDASIWNFQAVRFDHDPAFPQ